MAVIAVIIWNPQALRKQFHQIYSAANTLFNLNRNVQCVKFMTLYVAFSV